MKGRRGFSLVEVAIVAVVLTMVLIAVTNLAGTTGGALATGTSITVLEAKANRLLERIVAEMLQAGKDTLDPAVPAGSDAVLGYRRGVGFAGGEVEWGPPRRIELRSDEIQDGLDNDSDGLVDEHRVVWIEEPALPPGREVTWARGIAKHLEGEIANGVDDNGNGAIDEGGLCFQLQGDTLTVRLTVEGRDSAGRRLVRSATTALRLRN